MWNARLVLEGEQRGELDEEETKELEQKYSRRDLGSNADRYVEPEPELDSEGMLPILINLRGFTHLFHFHSNR